MWQVVLFTWIFASPVMSAFPCVPTCVTREILEGPAYGIDLSLDYLASAVKYANGTIQSLSKINASDEYREVMMKCLNVPDNGARQYSFGSRSTSPWMDHVNESVVETLSQEIRRLISSVDDMENIAVSIPTSYTNFLSNHVRQTMAGLGHPISEPYNLGPRDFMAISAYESGMCYFGNITPREHCGPNLNGRRNERYPPKFILVMESDHRPLAISAVLAFQGEVLFPVNRATFSLPTGGDKDVDWEEVTRWIASKVGAHRGMPDRPKFNKLVSVGALAASEAFQKAVWEALRMEADVVDLEKLHADADSLLDFQFVAAMGAAQVAKDWRDAPKPIGCKESDECKRIREETFNGHLTSTRKDKDFKDEL